MKRSMAHKKPALRSNPTTPREQRRERRDKVREEEHKKVRVEKDRTIDQKQQAKKREREEEDVENNLSNKLLKETPIQMAAGLQQPDVIGVAETGSGKAAPFISRKPKMRVIIPWEKFRFSFPKKFTSVF